jgi:hypothetical protein
MNRTEFLLTGGWPLKLERLDELQKDWQFLQALGELAGNFSIISGCNTAGTLVQNGVIYLNGELLEFRQAYLVPDVRVIIIEEETSKEFENGELKVLRKTRYATFGTAATNYPWANFTRPIPTNQIQAALNLKANITALNNLTARVETLEKYAAPFAVANGSMVFWRKPAN